MIENLQYYIDDSLETQQNQKQVQAAKIKNAEEIQAEFKRMKTQLGDINKRETEKDNQLESATA